MLPRHLHLSLPAVIVALVGGCSDAPTTDKQAPTPAEPPAPALTVEVRPGSGAYALRGLHSAIIRFQNSSAEPISILKPLEGSMDDRYMPYYRLTVWDADHEPLKPLRGWCGNGGGTWSGTRWPEDYLVEIKPGASFDEECYVPYEIPEDGSFNVSFEYVYKPTGRERFAPPPGAWRGSVKAPETVLKLTLK